MYAPLLGVKITKIRIESFLIHVFTTQEIIQQVIIPGIVLYLGWNAFSSYEIKYIPQSHTF